MSKLFMVFYILGSIFALCGEQIEGVRIEINPAAEKFLAGGPVLLSVKITNLRTETIHLDSDSAPPDMASYTVRQLDGPYLKPIEGNTGNSESELVVDMTSRSTRRINAGDSITDYIAINRRYEFFESGVFEIKVRVCIAATNDAAIRNGKLVLKEIGKTAIERTLSVSIENALPAVLEAELARYCSSLHDNDLSKRYAAVEALCYLKTPLAMKFLKSVVDTDNVRAWTDNFDRYAARMGIQALARFGTQEALNCIRKKLFAGKNSQIEAVLQAYAQRKELLPDEDIQRLKQHKNPWNLLWYLSEVGNMSHLDYAREFLGSENESIREIAKKCVEAIARREQEKK